MRVLAVILLLVACGCGSKPKEEPISEAAMEAGAAIYKQNCISCHQADGGGAAPMNPSLIKTSYVLGDKRTAIEIVLNGMSHQKVDGVSYHNAMPSFGFLSDKEIADVLTYVRNNFGNKASQVEESEVTPLRAAKQ